MSGTEKELARIARLKRLLNREVPFEPLGALLEALKPAREERQLDKVAFCLDSNILIKFGSHKKRDDIIDYLLAKHDGVLVMPGQTIQEFWNNQVGGYPTIAKNLKKRFDDFQEELAKIHSQFSEHTSKLQDLLNEFEARYGYVFDETAIKKMSSVFEMLQKRAVVAHAPRTEFDSICLNRKRTKTPPGFRDAGDGDFYVWVELLLGLSLAMDEGRNFEHVVLVTNDQKPDWSRNGVIHPILSAEVRALFNATIEVWTLDELAAAVLKVA